MVVLRLKRMGRTHVPFYRICAMDRRCPPDGRSLEDIGWYNPPKQEGQQYSGRRIAAYWFRWVPSKLSVTSSGKWTSTPPPGARGLSRMNDDAGSDLRFGLTS